MDESAAVSWSHYLGAISKRGRTLDAVVFCGCIALAASPSWALRAGNARADVPLLQRWRKGPVVRRGTDQAGRDGEIAGQRNRPPTRKSRRRSAALFRPTNSAKTAKAKSSVPATANSPRPNDDCRQAHHEVEENSSPRPVGDPRTQPRWPSAMRFPTPRSVRPIQPLLRRLPTRLTARNDEHAPSARVEHRVPALDAVIRLRNADSRRRRATLFNDAGHHALRSTFKDLPPDAPS